MVEYCSVTYAWVGRGWTQEISWLRIQDKKVLEWEGQYWTTFLNHMAQQQWELVAVAPLGGGDGGTSGVVAYFKRFIQQRPSNM